MRQRQELINHARGAVDAGDQCVQRRTRFLWRTCAIGDLSLHSDRRQRRSQFMRGCGGEVRLRIDRPLDAAEEGIEGVQQRLELPWADRRRRPDADRSGDRSVNCFED